MRRRRVCVPIHSPVWEHYVREGWVELSTQGTWVTMAQPLTEPVATPGANVVDLRVARAQAHVPSGRGGI